MPNVSVYVSEKLCLMSFIHSVLSISIIERNGTVKNIESFYLRKSLIINTIYVSHLCYSDR